jgi:hypothetical protein
MTAPGLCTVPRCVDASGTQPREAGHGRWACPQCVADVRLKLRHIEVYAGILPHLLRPGRGPDTRRAPGFGSRAPARLDVVVARDIRSHTTVVGPEDESRAPVSILGTLHTWARWIRCEQDVSAPRSVTVTSEVGYLLSAAEWCSRHPWVPLPFAEVLSLHNQCRRQAYDHPGRPIGRCPTLLPSGRECRTPLFVPSTGDSVRCHGCRRTWERRVWEHLARTLTDRRRPA